MRKSLVSLMLLVLVSGCSSNNNPTPPPMPPGGGAGAAPQCNSNAGGSDWPGIGGLVQACVQQQNSPQACNCMAIQFTKCYSWNSYQQLWQNPAVNQQANNMLNQCMAQGGGGPGQVPPGGNCQYGGCNGAYTGGVPW